MKANCWFAFLCASIRVLAPEGSLCFLLPAAWEYANYAKELRLRLPQYFRRVTTHRSRRPLFRHVKEGSIVLVAEGFIGEVDGTFRDGGVVVEHQYESIDELIAGLKSAHAPTRSSVSAPPGTRHNTASLRGASCLIPAGRSTRAAKSDIGTEHAPYADITSELREFIQIRLGGVTGDAHYFVLSEAERVGFGLPQSACRPVVSRAHHLGSAEITRGDWLALREAGERVWLFCPAKAQIRHPKVKQYLELPPDEGGCHRTRKKVSARNPWYCTPLQRTIDGFMSGMSRHGPWVVFRSMPRLAATNTLYLVRFLRDQTPDERAARAMWLLATEAQPYLRRIGRRYADGLVKYEPGDISRLPARQPRFVKGAYQAYLTAVSHLTAGRIGESRAIADRWF